MKYQYEIHHKLDGRCLPRVRWKILWLFWSKWWDIVTFSGTGVYLFPVSGWTGYDEKGAHQAIEDFKEV